MATSKTTASRDDIGDRFKAYEAVFDFCLPRRVPLIIRVDGRAFHSLKLAKPFDAPFAASMVGAATALCEEIQGARFAYVQSDEISVVARDDMSHETQPWVGKRLNKLVSLSAAIATSVFNHLSGLTCQFDSRAFIVPDVSEAINYAIWRQQDATRNSVSMAARAVFSHRECDRKSTADLVEMLRSAGKPWEETRSQFKRGVVVRRVARESVVPATGQMVMRSSWEADLEPPAFSHDRGYLESILSPLPDSASGNGEGLPRSLVVRDEGKGKGEGR